MSWLLDVNMILAARWTTHADHPAAKAWMDSVGEFYTCAITELGFLRISLSAAYRASWEQTQEALAKLHARPGHRFLSDDVDGAASPAILLGKINRLDLLQVLRNSLMFETPNICDDSRLRFGVLFLK
jgi:predicted nucleic acid-binding protein